MAGELGNQIQARDGSRGAISGQGGALSPTTKNKVIVFVALALVVVVPCFGWLILSAALGLSKLWTVAVMILCVAPGQSIFFLLLSRRFPWFDEE